MGLHHFCTKYSCDIQTRTLQSFVSSASLLIVSATISPLLRRGRKRKRRRRSRDCIDSLSPVPSYLSIYLSILSNLSFFLSFFLSFCELFHLFNIVRWMASVIQHCLRSAGVHTYDDSDQTSTQDGKQQHQDEQENKEKH